MNPLAFLFPKPVKLEVPPATEEELIAARKLEECTARTKLRMERRSSKRFAPCHQQEPSAVWNVLYGPEAVASVELKRQAALIRSLRGPLGRVARWVRLAARRRQRGARRGTA